MLKVFLLIINLSVLLAAEKDHNRLPSDVYPTAYKLWIDAQKSFDGTYAPFSGKVDIELNVRTQTNQLTINSFDLDINKLTLYEVRDKSYIEIPTIFDESYAFEQVEVTMANANDMFDIGKTYSLSIEYDGYVHNVAEGIYIKRGTTSDGTTISILTTNFVPLSTRFAIPCYDEPEYKATFRLTIVHSPTYSVMSNMPIESFVIVGGVKTTTFQTTPLLSPHSFGFVVTQLDNFRSARNGKFVAYYDQSHDKEEVSVALEASEKILNALESYLDTSIGVPEIKDVPQFDYIKTKIGNLGLVLNDMRYYYINPNSTQFQYDEVIRHVSRLMANQFFGNLIASEFWDDAWFTQGLSILFEYYIVESEYPELKSMDIFMAELYNNFYDWTLIYREVNWPDLTRFLLTDWYAWKSTQMIFMLQNILTEDIFKLALRTLLSEYRNAPVSTKLFFDVLTRVGHENGVLSTSYDLNIIMDTWIIADNSPILEVSRDYDTGVVTLKQNDYVTYTVIAPPDDGAIWWIPYNYITGNGTFTWDTLPDGWLEGESTKDLDLSANLKSDDWILFNIKQTGFYHTLYDRTNWLLLANQLSNDHEKIHYINRGHLVADAFFFGYLNYTTFDVALEVANYLNNETSTFPFQILFREEFDTMVNSLYGTEVYSNFTIFMRNKIANIYDRVRVSRDVTELDFDELSIRTSVTKFACQMRLDACLQDAYAVFLKYYKNADDKIFTQIALDYESDLGSWLLKYGFMLTNEEEFSYMFDRINHGLQNNVHYEIATIIGMSQNQVHVDRLMNILVTKNGDSVFEHTIDLTFNIRYFIFKALVYNNEYALDVAFLYLEDMYTPIMEIYGLGSLDLVICLSERTTTPERFEKLIRIGKMYEIEYFQDFEIEIGYANLSVEWYVERAGEFQGTLAKLVEGPREEEDPGNSQEVVGGNDDGGGNSITISIFALVLTLLIVVCTH